MSTPDTDGAPATVNLIYRKRHHLVSFDAPLSQITLAQLYPIATSTLNLPPHQAADLRFIFAGGVMKDNSASLSQFGIHPNANILVLATPHHQATDSSSDPSIATLHPAPPPPPPSSSSSLLQTTSSPFTPGLANPKEMAVVAHISDLLSRSLAPLNPRLHQFATLTPSSPDDIAKTKSELVERLMQALLKVDAVAVPPGYALARAKRREAVNTLQSLMDEVEHRFRTLIHHITPN